MEISYAELHRKLGINVAYYRKLKGLTKKAPDLIIYLSGSFETIIERI